MFIPLDLETGDADDLYRKSPCPGYIRLIGIGGTAFACGNGRTVATHQPYVTVNGNYFDFPALDRHCGIPVETTIPFSRDLRVAAFQHDPPTTYQTKRGPGFKNYSMAALAHRYLGEDPDKYVLKSLANEYGGYDRIPLDDPRYHAYLRDDLDITRRLNAAIPWDPYEEREAWVSAITARTTLNGFRVDVPGLTDRAHDLQLRAEDGRALLETFGFPSTLENGKEAKAPQRTKAGKAAFEQALTASGFPVDSWPRGADGSLSLSKETMAFAVEHAVTSVPSALPVIEAVQTMNGIRNNAANVLRCVSDGRVHAQFLPFQSTGRWSVQEPGLTVLKKGVPDSERYFLIADEDEVLGTIDLDQIDIRCAAAHAQDPALLALLNDSQRDIHTEISAMAKVDRKAGKTLDLGWLYGRTVNGLAATPGIARKDAQAVSDYMHTTFPGVVRWQHGVRERGELGLLLNNGFGRRLRVDPQRAFTQAPALIGQSATRDMIAEGLIDLARRAPEILPMLRVIVHDEVVFCAPRKDFEEVSRTVQECMSRQWAPEGASMPVSVTAGQGKPFVSGERWGQLYE